MSEKSNYAHWGDVTACGTVTISAADTTAGDTSNAIPQQPHCPVCGACPHCGHKARPYEPIYPYYPQPWANPNMPAPWQYWQTGY